MALVTWQELQTYLQRPVVQATGELAIRVAEGWLRSVVTLTPWPPDPVPEDLWAWELELASIAYSNPEGLQTRTVDAVTDAWSVARRAEILDAAGHRYGAQHPIYSFPPAVLWP